MVIVLMGVAGSGKTTVGELLASRLGWPFADADDYHPSENIEKMRDGIGLNDFDREPWLDRLQSLISSWIGAGTSGVLACSALKQAYRDRLQAVGEVQFVYLKGEPELLRQRLRERSGHYMRSDMLESQLATLEEPQDAVTIDVTQPQAEIVEEIVSRLGPGLVS